MTQNILDDFIARARTAAAAAHPRDALRELLTDSINQSTQMSDAIAAMPEDEVMLFEDETCSIWTCRYGEDVVFPPHEHCMPVHIAVYHGAEVEVLYKREPQGLRHGGNHIVSAGQVTSLGTDAVHAITGDGDGQSHAIHIYEGPLTQVERALFDWETGKEVAFTMENFRAMQRNKSDMAEFK